MDEAMEQLVDDIKESIGRRDINLIADAGLLQNILSELDIWEDIPNGTKKKAGARYMKMRYLVNLKMYF